MSAVRARLLATTFLTSLAGGLFAVSMAYAKDPAPAQLPAVDGLNGKLEIMGGEAANAGLFGGQGSLSAPLGGQYGVQVDGAAGAFDSRFVGGGAAHLFWRNPQQGLLGAYGDAMRWERYGVNIGHVGGEGEAYLGRWTLRGVAGAEFNNNPSSTTIVPIAGGFVTNNATIGKLNGTSRFFDLVTLSYYITDNWAASIGQRYLGGKDALALGTEYALPSHSSILPSLFAEARIGSGSNNYGAWGGVRFYFGNSDKTLIRRNREDDPTSTLFDIASTLGPGSTSSTGTCTNGEIFQNGQCSGGL